VISYITIILLAVEKGRDILDTFSLTVWLFSALIVFLATGLIAVLLFAVLAFRANKIQIVVAVWMLLIVVLGLGLIANAA